MTDAIKNRNLIILTILAAFASVALVGYTLFWFTTAREIENAIKPLRDNPSVHGNISGVSGFPMRPRVSFSGDIDIGGGVSISIPRLTVTGIPIPGQTVTIAAPDGFSSQGSPDPGFWSLDKGEAVITIPYSIPETATVEALRVWREQVGDSGLTVNSFSVQKDSLAVSGSANISLDANLQPAGTVTIAARGYMAFIGWLQGRNMLTPEKALMTGTILNGLSAQDPDSGERVLHGTLTLQNSKILLGPVQIAPVPVIVWPYAH